MINVIEKRTIEGPYGFDAHQIIIDHPKHGRLLLTDGFGGMDDIRGGAVRYEHGLVCKLLPNDTFAVLDSGGNEFFTRLYFVLDGQDKNRPVLNWDGVMVDKLAQSIKDQI